jgi:hypothetical protein
MAKNKYYTSLIAAMFCLSQVSNAQITLEHTFLNESVSFNMGVVNGELNYLSEVTTYPENSFYLAGVVNNSYRIKIYNSDYSLHTNQTYNFTPPEGYRVASVSPSKKLFNTDSNYEFLVRYTKISYSSYDNEDEKLILYDANGNIIKDFGTGYSFWVSSQLYIINNKYKLLIYRNLFDEEDNSFTNTEIYSVPGTPSSSNVRTASVNSRLSPYPNPANTVITLPYKLEQGEFSVMNIFSISGQLIETKQIGYDFDKILLNVSNYAKGVYFYEINGVSNRFIVE